jgi:dihydrofolate reductase
MAAAPPKLRILALHGFASNAFHFNRRLGSFRKATGAVAELHFLNAPHLVQPVSVTLGLEARDDLVDENTPLEEQPRAWWRANGQGQSQYDGWPETLAFLNDALAEHGPFDAVLGFSQGA